MVIRLNESVANAVEEARQERLRQKIEAEVTQRLIPQFTRQLAEKEPIESGPHLKFHHAQGGTSSTVSPDSCPFEEQPDEDEEADTTNLGDDYHL